MAGLEYDGHGFLYRGPRRGTQTLSEADYLQGAQFTANAFTQTLEQAEVQISMDGRGRCYDNIFIERLWRSIKYELIYLKAFDDGHHLSQEVSAWFHFYNRQRFHQALNYRTPDEIYFEACSKSEVMCNSY